MAPARPAIPAQLHAVAVTPARPVIPAIPVQPVVARAAAAAVVVRTSQSRPVWLQAAAHAVPVLLATPAQRPVVLVIPVLPAVADVALVERAGPVVPVAAAILAQQRMTQAVKCRVSRGPAIPAVVVVRAVAVVPAAQVFPRHRAGLLAAARAVAVAPAVPVPISTSPTKRPRPPMTASRVSFMPVMPSPA